jgi:hypothetical protein
MRGWILACLLSGLVAACETPVAATGSQGAFSWGSMHPAKGSPDSVIWGGGAGCNQNWGPAYPASDLFEHLREECVLLVAVDGARSPGGWGQPPALVPPGPHRLTFSGAALPRVYEFPVEIKPSRGYRPHAEEEDGNLYVWLTEHPLPMPPFDDGMVFYGEPPPESD